jgi:hypothetical protein
MMMDGIKKNKMTRMAAGDMNQKPVLALRRLLSTPSLGGASVALVTAMAFLLDAG